MVPVEAFMGTIILVIYTFPVIIKQVNRIRTLHSCTQVKAFIQLVFYVIQGHYLTHDMGYVTCLGVPMAFLNPCMLNLKKLSLERVDTDLAL